MNRPFLAGLAALAVIIFSLNLLLGSMISGMVRDGLTELSQQQSNELMLEVGEIETRPFFGDIELNELSLRQAGVPDGETNRRPLYLGQLTIDLSYIDFLSLYLRGIRQGAERITNLTISADRVSLRRANGVRLTAKSFSWNHQGSAWQVFKSMATGVRPETPFSTRLSVKGTAFALANDAEQPIDPIRLGDLHTELRFEPGFQSLTVSEMRLSNGPLNGSASGNLLFKRNNRSLRDLTKIQLNGTFRTDATEPFSIPARYGSIELADLVWKIRIESNDLPDDPISEWYRISSEQAITAGTVTFLPDKSLSNSMGLVFGMLGSKSDRVTFREGNLELTSNPNAIKLEELSLSHPAFQINGIGTALTANTPSLSQANLVATRLSMTGLTQRQINILSNAARMFGMNLRASGDGFSFALTGRLGSPNIRF